MKCPVSMLPTGGTSTSAILLVIGVIATISYAIQTHKKPAINSTTKP